jgi:hypothetical protein
MMMAFWPPHEIAATAILGVNPAKKSEFSENV